MFRMPTLPALLFLLLLSSGLRAQVGMQLRSTTPRFLRYEGVELLLVVRNYSGNTLIFSGADRNDEGRIFFNVLDHTGRMAKVVDKNANPGSELILAPGETRELKIILNTLYDMQREGSYSVTAYLNHSRLPKTSVSNTIDLEVRDGTTLVEKDVGLPSEESTGVIKSLRLVLLLFHDVNEKVYCLRAEDDENVYAVFRLGPYISGYPPQMDIDGNSSLHVLIQVRPKLYSYVTYSFLGRNLQLRQQRYYVPDRGVPTLNRNNDFLRITQARPATEGIDFRLKEGSGSLR